MFIVLKYKNNYINVDTSSECGVLKLGTKSIS